MMQRRTIISIALTLSFIGATLIFLWVVFNASPVATGKYLAAQVGSAIGVSVSIPPNPFSTLAQQLNEKEESLSVKEGELKKYVFAIGGALFALVLANFYFDWRRRK